LKIENFVIELWIVFAIYENAPRPNLVLWRAAGDLLILRKNDRAIFLKSFCSPAEVAMIVPTLTTFWIVPLAFTA
jgi:hypothetical protein